MADVSVVLCTYNGERYVAEQLRSILDQTVRPAEVVVGDDGSTDRTLEILWAAAQGSPVPVQVHRNERRLGYAGNFLSTARRTTAPLIAFSDQDDRWAPRKLEKQRDALLRNEALLSVHPVAFADGEGNRLGTNEDAFGPERVVPPSTFDPWNNFYGFTMLFRRELVDEFPAEERGLDIHSLGDELAHDRWIYFLASTFGRIAMVSECLADYRQHGGQLYGGEPARGLRERISTKLRTGQEQAAYLAGVAAHRAEFLDGLASGPRGDLARQAARRWRGIEHHLTARAEVYAAPGPLEALRKVLGNLRAGAYLQPQRGGLGGERLAEDLVVALTRGLANRRSPE